MTFPPLPPQSSHATPAPVLASDSPNSMTDGSIRLPDMLNDGGIERPVEEIVEDLRCLKYTVPQILEWLARRYTRDGYPIGRFA